MLIAKGHLIVEKFIADLLKGNPEHRILIAFDKADLPFVIKPARKRNLGKG